MILKNRKYFFFLSEVVLLHQTIIKEWLKFCRKVLTPTFILIPMFIKHLRVCKMIISLGFFFHFLKILIFWVKNGVKEQKWPKIGKKLVHTLSDEQHEIWLRFLVCLWFLIFLVHFRHFFIFRKFQNWVKNGIKGKLAKNNL